MTELGDFVRNADLKSKKMKVENAFVKNAIRRFLPYHG